MPLTKVDNLVTLFFENGWIYQTKHCYSEEEMRIKAKLMILGIVKVLGHHATFQTLPANTRIPEKHHRIFFHSSINFMYNIRVDYIGYPPTEMELQEVMQRYSDKFLPGCSGLIDAVHVKWSKCPAGDINRCKGEEGFSSVAFEVVSGFDRQILGVSPVHFGTWNDQQIVLTDETVILIKNEWYQNVCWN